MRAPVRGGCARYALQYALQYALRYALQYALSVHLGKLATPTQRLLPRDKYGK